MSVGDRQPYYPNSISRSYLRFNLSTLPAGAVIDTARLCIYNNVMNHPAIGVGAHCPRRTRASGAGIGDITWNNAPTGFEALPTTLLTVNLCVDRFGRYES